jgi:diguanylate cyclase (GGDEF)-like protein/PAS domain S-box-containing protein
MSVQATERSDSRSDRLDVEEVDLIAQARERSQRHAERRELYTEAVASSGFVGACAVTVVLFGMGSIDLVLVAWLTAIIAVLARVEFEVGEGCTRPLQLVFAPMLVLLPPALIAPVVVLGHIAARLPDIVARGYPLRRVFMGLADSWFAVPPAVIVGLLGLPHSPREAVVLVAAALAGQLTCDFVVSSLRVHIGVGVELRSLLRPFAWVYLVDLLLLPIGLLAAWAAYHQILALAAVVPLALLLGIFARERRGRLDNALALQRMTEETKERLQSIVRNASDLIAIVRPDGTMATLTGSVESVFGSDWRQAEGQALLDYVHPDDRGLLRAFLSRVAAKAHGESEECEWRLRYPDGTWRHLAGTATNLIADARIEGLVVTARNVDERKAFEEQLRHRAFHDPLTGLANRALFYDRVEHALSRGDRHDGETALLFVDLDDLKAINDEHGHACGDELLVEVARRIQASVRGPDTAARLGGDEFGVLIESCAGPNEPVQVAQRILSALSGPYNAAGRTVTLSASIGVALSGHGPCSVEDLLRRGDLAMYAAKRNGKRGLELYVDGLETDGHSDLADRVARLQSNDTQREEIVSVLTSDTALTMVFQPILDLRSGRVAGYEALARFADAAKRPPNAWFAQAHRCGLGHELEAKALAAALATPGRPAGTYMTVNLSPSALTSAPVADALPARLDDVVIEITENQAIADDERISATLGALRARGARLAIDDTGSGYAGLTQVLRLAPDIIKLDRALVAGVHEDAVRAALIASFVRYAHDIGATVCAEGVETMEDLARLADLDVAYGQGYGIARPAAPWAAAGEPARRACRDALAASLSTPAVPGTEVGDDRRLERLLARLSGAWDLTEVTAATEAIAAELEADGVSVLAAGRAFSTDARLIAGAAEDAPEGIDQVLAGDPDADDAQRAAMLAQGFQSRLSLPVSDGGVRVGTLQAFATSERPWTRFQVSRARVIALSLGATLTRIAALGSEPGLSPQAAAHERRRAA